MERLLTVKEVAEALQISRMTLWRWERTEGFPRAIMMRGIKRFRATEIEAWVAAHVRPEPEDTTND